MTEAVARLRVPVTEDVVLSAFPRRLEDLRGAPFLLVHGLASNARMWDGVGEELARLGHPSVAIDQRGHGRASKPDDGYDFGTLTNDLLRGHRRDGHRSTHRGRPILGWQRGHGARRPPPGPGEGRRRGRRRHHRAVCGDARSGSRQRPSSRRPTCGARRSRSSRSGSGGHTRTGRRPVSRARSPTSRSWATARWHRGSPASAT